MMADDFGGGGPVRPYDSALTNYELREQNKALKAELKEVKDELNVYKMAPLRRSWHNFKKGFVNCIPYIVVLGIPLAVVGAVSFGDKYATKRDYESCEFAAKIQATKFEFDKNNKKCYLYDSKFERYMPHGIKNPD
ncbi:hypothetical protein [Stenotrophomonas phage RAS14]